MTTNEMERHKSDKTMQQTHRQVSVVNPYLKETRTTPAPAISTTSSSKMMAAMATTTIPATASIRKNGRVTGPTIASTAALRMATTTPNLIRSSNHVARNINPYQKSIGGKNPTVTPTPKKQTPGVKPGHRQAPNSTGTHSDPLTEAPLPTHPAISVTQPRNTKVESLTVVAAPRKKQPGCTLKSQLKSQIAQLHRQKRQFLEHKEAEKQRLLKEQEKERLRIEREKELKRLAAIKEQERQKKESEKQRKIVGYCINDMVKIVERRSEMEQKYGGANYAIGETMEYLLKTIECKEKMMLKARREKQLLTKEIRMCLDSMIYAVEQRMHSQASMQQQQHQFRMMNYPYYHQVIQSYGMHNPTIAQSVMMMHHPMIQGGYHPHTIQSFPYFSHHRPPHTLNQIGSSQMMPLKVANPLLPHQHRQQPVKATPPALLHSSPENDPFSPYSKSHHVLPADVVLTKQSTGESFGVILRWECKSVLIPTAEGSGNANSISTTVGGDSQSPTLTEKKQRRKRVNFGVMAVVDASKAKFSASTLKPGDIILAINGRPCGGSTFTDACRAIGTTSIVCPSSGEIRCVLKVARMNAIIVKSADVKPFQQISRLPSSSHIMETLSLIPIAPTVHMIPYLATEDKVISGEFTTDEWSALIRGLSEFPFQLFKGLALIPVTQRETLVSIMKSENFGKSLHRRTREALEAKLAFESRRILLYMQKKAEEYWSWKWQAEQQQDTKANGDESFLEGPLTDAKRSALREAARPSKGCKCGSKTHEYVSNVNCPLYRDVRQYCEVNSIDYHGENPDVQKISIAKNSIKAKNSMEKAYIDRFVRLREANAADREEAEFVLKMEKIQVSRMKKAVLVPPSLCTLVLSAVVSVMDKLDDKELKLVHQQVMGSHKQSSSANNQPAKSDSDESKDSDDDEAVPLASLAQQQSLKRTSTNGDSPLPSKRPKVIERCKSGTSRDEIVAPNPYFMAEILKHVSTTHGHLFQGKTPC